MAGCLLLFDDLACAQSEQALGDGDYLLIRHAHMFMEELEHLYPGEVVVPDRVSLPTFGAFKRSGNSLSNLADGQHGGASWRVHGGAFHAPDLLNQEGPDGFAPGLGAEDVQQLQYCNIKVLVGKTETHVFLVNTAADVRVPAGQFLFRPDFGKVGELGTQDDSVLHPVGFCNAQQALERGDVEFFEHFIHRRGDFYPFVNACGENQSVMPLYPFTRLASSSSERSM